MLTIGTFSKISKVPTKTLRYYDEIGLIKPIYVNSETQYRYYNVDQLKTVLLINRLKGYCCSLEEISEVLKNPFDYHLLFSLIKQKQNDIQEKINNYKYVLSQLDKDLLNLEREIDVMSYLDDIQVKLIETKRKNILFIREKMNVQDYGKYMDKLFETITKEKFTPVGVPMTIYHSREFTPENYDMEIAIPVKEVTEKTRELSECLCIMGSFKGPYSEIPSAYAKMREWMEKEGYDLIDSPYELYLTDPNEVAPEDYITEVYFPVKKI